MEKSEKLIRYFSLDEAREELKNRWNNSELKEKIEKELGSNFISLFREKPRGVTFRQLCSPDNGFTFFNQCSNYIGANPLVLEYHEDIFIHFNEEKMGLGNLHLNLKNGEKTVVKVMNFRESEKKKLSECLLKNGKKLVDFHHELFDVLGYKTDFLENSNWFINIGRASEYYYYLLLHFVAHGVLFESFSEEDGESDLINKTVVPSIVKIYEKFGLEPIICRLYPKNQTEEEDFYWWSYPPIVNDYILEYIKNYQLN